MLCDNVVSKCTQNLHCIWTHASRVPPRVPCICFVDLDTLGEMQIPLAQLMLLRNAKASRKKWMFFVKLLDLEWNVHFACHHEGTLQSVGSFGPGPSTVIFKTSTLSPSGFRALCLLQLTQHLLVKPFAWLGIKGNMVVENSMLKLCSWQSLLKGPA